MKKYISVFLLLLPITFIFAEEKMITVATVQEEYTVVDRIDWLFYREISKGDIECKHDWIYSIEWFNEGVDSDEPIDFSQRPPKDCGKDHNGFHCPNYEKVRNQICSQCGRIEQWREKWTEHKVQVQRPILKSAYEVYKSSFTLKKIETQIEK